jgi:short-subunit dehydrogenase
MHPNRPSARAVVVVGATTAIGREFCHGLARRGHDLVLVSPDRMAIERVADEVGLATGVTVVPVVADLADTDAPYWVDDAILGADVAVHGLVTTDAVGVRAGAEATDFVDVDPEAVLDEVTTRVTGITLLTRILLPRIIASRGLLVHLTSAPDDRAAPRPAVQSASRAFVTSLTESIWHETRGTGVRAVVVRTGPDATDLVGPGRGVRTLAAGDPDLEDVVRATLSALEEPRLGPERSFVSTSRLHRVISRLARRHRRRTRERRSTSRSTRVGRDDGREP